MGSSWLASETPAESEAREIVRPSIPTLWWIAAGSWLGAVAAEEVAWRSGLEAHGAVLAVIAAFCASAVALGAVRARHGSVAALFACALAGVCAIGLCVWTDAGRDGARLEETGVRDVGAEVVEDVRKSKFGDSTECVLRDGPARGARVRVLLPEGGRRPELGQRVVLDGTFASPSHDERGRRLHRAGICGTVRASRASPAGWARSLRGTIGPVRAGAAQVIGTIPGPGGALLAGVTLGDRRRLRDTETEQAFRISGLSHLIAVSGTHLVVVSVCLGWLLRATRIAPQARVAVLAAVLGAYVVLTAVQPSAVRAWTMATCAGVGALASRRTDSGAALGGAVVGVLLLSPASAFDLGFQLSVVAVAGLVLFGRLAEAWLRAALGPARGLAGPLALTGVAQFATVPLTVPTFGMMSLVGPVANAVCGPLVAASLPIGLTGLCAGLVAPDYGHMLLRAAAAMLSAADGVAVRLASIPHAAVPVGASAVVVVAGVSALSAAVWAAWPRPTVRRARAWAVLGCTLLVAATITPPAIGGPELVMLDVGQGDAILVRDRGSSMLIDGGPDSVALRHALSRAGVRSLDAVVVTHLHEDHSAGLEGLQGTVPVHRLVVTEAAAEDLDESELVGWLGGSSSLDIRAVRPGATLRCGDIALAVLSPEAGSGDPRANEHSLVLLAKAPGWSALLTGDAETDVLAQLVGCGAVGDVDILKVGHHGSDEAVSADTLGALKPEVALVSVGEGNRFGHPAGSTLHELERCGTRVFRTDRDGDVRLSVSGGSLVRVP